MSLLPLLYDHEPYSSHPLTKWSSLPNADLHDDFPLQEWPTMITRGASLDNHLRDLRHQIAKLDKDTTITVDKHHFQADIDVQQFQPNEIAVKLTGENTITVEAKHEERADGHGLISRHFVRRYIIPKDCDVSKLQSHLSSDGVLTITAPKKTDDEESVDIPIMHSGRPRVRMHLWPSRKGDAIKRKRQNL